MKNLLITSTINISYLSGFTGSKAIILQTPSHNYFITDTRYFDEAKKNIPQNFILEKYKKNEFEEFWPKILKKHHVKELAFESNHLTYSALKYWKKISRPTKLIPQINEIEKLRAIKTSQEIALITHSQRINEQVFYSIIKLLKPGVKESEIAWKIHTIAHDLNADGLSFEPIIAFGKNSSIPHHK
ncbi:MAG: aminopeptidase P family N-terminal domain-containing protein, partial [Candidatus Gracilibacteria bacterium]